MTGLVRARSLALYLAAMALIGTAVRSWAEGPVDGDRRRAFAGPWIPLAVIAAGAIAMQIWCNVRGYSGWSFSLRRRGWSISVSARCV